jgi:hypothetical protein
MFGPGGLTPRGNKRAEANNSASTFLTAMRIGKILTSALKEDYMKTRFKRRVCKLQLRLSSYGGSYYIDRIAKLETALKRGSGSVSILICFRPGLVAGFGHGQKDQKTSEAQGKAGFQPERAFHR